MQAQIYCWLMTIYSGIDACRSLCHILYGSICTNMSGLAWCLDVGDISGGNITISMSLYSAYNEIRYFV